MFRFIGRFIGFVEGSKSREHLVGCEKLLVCNNKKTDICIGMGLN